MSAPVSIGQRKRAAIWFWIVFYGLGLVGCMAGCVWAVLTLELSITGSFGLFGGHWAFGLLMPGMIVSLLGLMLAIGRLRQRAPAQQSPERDVDTPPDAGDPR